MKNDLYLANDYFSSESNDSFKFQEARNKYESPFKNVY